MTAYGMVIRPADGDRVVVMWPNKDVTTETIVIRTHTRSVSDHGKACDATSHIAGVILESRGAKVWLPLDAPGLLVEYESLDITK